MENKVNRKKKNISKLDIIVIFINCYHFLGNYHVPDITLRGFDIISHFIEINKNNLC